MLSSSSPAVRSGRRTLGIERLGQYVQAVVIFVLLVVVAIIMLGPFLWMFSTAFKPGAEVFVFPPQLIPRQFTTESLVKVFTAFPFARYTLNTTFLAFVGVGGEIIVCSMAAYSFARLRWPGRDKVFFLYLGTMMIPGAVTMIPAFLVMKTFGWMDNWMALIVPGLSSAFGTFLLRQFFMTIPKDMEDAARIDGCGRFAFYWRILMPLTGPALATLAIFGFMGRWNSFLWPLLIMKTKELFVLQLGLATFRSEYGTQHNLLMAATTVAVIPILVVFYFAQSFFIKGVILSGIKG